MPPLFREAPETPDRLDLLKFLLFTLSFGNAGLIRGSLDGNRPAWQRTSALKGTG